MRLYGFSTAQLEVSRGAKQRDETAQLAIRGAGGECCSGVALTDVAEQRLARLVLGHRRVGAGGEVFLQAARRDVGRADDDHALVALRAQRLSDLGPRGHVDAARDLAAQILVKDEDMWLRRRSHDGAHEAAHHLVGVGRREATGREDLRVGVQWRGWLEPPSVDHAHRWFVVDEVGERGLA